MKDIFRHADKALMVIYTKVSKEFSRLGTQLGFDELNVLGVQSEIRAMYRRMDNAIRGSYFEIARLAYLEGLEDARQPVTDFDAKAFVDAILKAYDPLSDFVYTREYARKRERLFESVIATQIGNQEMRKNLKRGMDVLANQIRQYADNITISARLQAFEDSGIEYGMWVAEKDEKTCPECLANDGKIYTLAELRTMIPAHWHCRCIVMPVL